jgi:hypothetical protein
MYKLVNENKRVIIYLPNLREGLELAKEKNVNDICIDTQNVNRNNLLNQYLNIDFKLISEYEFIESISISDSKQVFEKNFNINELSGVKNLKELRLDDKRYSVDFSLFVNLNKLEFFYNSSCENLFKLTNLEYLHIYNFNSVDLQELSKMEKLRNLILWDAKKLISLDGLSKVNDLQIIDMVRANNLVDITVFNRLSLLKVKFFQCKMLSDISVISELNKLEVLTLLNCKNLKDYNQITPNNSLKALIVSEIPTLEFVVKLKSLERIGFDNVTDNDLSPLLKAEKLRTACFPSKRSYNHTEKQIRDLLQQ